MTEKKNILAIIGSASSSSTNLQLVEKIADLIPENFQLNIYNDLKTLPHFDPETSANNPPEEVINFRKKIEQADGIIICTPEYVFSIPSGLKNAIEWCVITTIFLNKPTGLITASADGQKGHEELQLIMKTVMAKFTHETCLLIQGIKGKIDKKGGLTDNVVKKQIHDFTENLVHLINR